MPCPAGPRLVNSTRRGFMRCVRRVFSFSPPVGEFAREVSATPRLAGCGAVGSVWFGPRRRSVGAADGSCACRHRGELDHPTLSDQKPPGAGMWVTSPVVPRQGQFFLILPCKFIGLPVAKPQWNLKLLQQPPRPHPVWRSPPGFNYVIFPAARPVPSSLWAVRSRCKCSLGWSKRRKVPSCLYCF